MLTPLTKMIRALFYGTALFSLAIGINVVQLWSVLLIPFSRRRVWNINTRGAFSLWWVMQYIFERRHKGKISYSGDELSSGDSAIVISNHRSFSDFYMLHSIAVRRNMLPHLKYFAKDSLKFIPFFGWGMWLMGMLFVTRNWTQDEAKIEKMFKTIKRYEAPVWIVNFLEGTRATPQKLKDSQQYARKNNLPVLKNLLNPRTKGFLACVRQLRNTHVKYVYGRTARTKNEKKTADLPMPPNLIQVHAYPVLSPPWSFHVHIRRYAIEDLPKSEEKLVEWVKRVFVDKDNLLEEMKKHWTNAKAL
ncbi:5607_t:CDS:2, partial [Paraglomus occultum]